MRLFSLSAFALTLALGFAAQATELDNESQVTNQQIQASRDLPATMVVRVNEATRAVEVLHTADRVAPDAATASVIAGQPFVAAPQAGATVAGELDRNSSASSWYYCYNGWYQPSYYYYYGYSYSYVPYYSYYYGGYSYAYYRWSYGWY